MTRRLREIINTLPTANKVPFFDGAEMKSFIVKVANNKLFETIIFTKNSAKKQASISFCER